MQERRQFYRINDMVSLNYKVVLADNAEQEIDNAKHGYSELTDLRNALLCVDSRLDDITEQLSKDYPLIAEMVTLINKKIALYERMLGNDDYKDHILSPAREVNLSANGVAFEAETSIPEGTALKLELVTYPEHHYIPVYARVVSCKQNSNGSSSNYMIAVEFEAISEKDQERIINHIFKKQAGELKRQRNSNEQSEASPDESISF